MKYCYDCKRILPLTEFNNNRTNKDGKQKFCKECQRNVNKKYYRNNKEKFKARDSGKIITEGKRDKTKERERQKLYWQKHKAKRNATKKLYREANPEKSRARDLLNYAVKRGRIIRPDNCSKCGGHDSVIGGHHPDYSKPLEVIWLCESCHRVEHLLPEYQAPYQTLEARR